MGFIQIIFYFIRSRQYNSRLCMKGWLTPERAHSCVSPTHFHIVFFCRTFIWMGCKTHWNAKKRSASTSFSECTKLHSIGVRDVYGVLLTFHWHLHTLAKVSVFTCSVGNTLGMYLVLVWTNPETSIQFVVTKKVFIVSKTNGVIY